MSIALNKVCLRTLSLDKPASIDTYLSIGGYKVLQQILENKTEPGVIVQRLANSNLRGRGGAGFKTATKWQFLLESKGNTRYLVCNSDESEPGTFKDRDILRYNPHQLIEGILISCYTLGVKTAYNYMRGEYVEPFNAMEQALAEAKKRGFVGAKIMNSDFSCEIHNLIGAGAYICGEESALLESIEGKKGMPRFKPPYPASVGLYGKPTVINNTETLASVPVIIENKVPAAGEYKIFSVSGHVAKPGNYEVRLGTPFREVLQLAGGVRDNKALKAAILGGTSVPVLPAASLWDLNLDYEEIAAAGSMLGSGGMIIMDHSTSMVKVLARIADFYYEESCGQCSPCREGTGWIARILHRVQQGIALSSEIDELEVIARNMMGRTICAFGEAAAMPVLSFLQHFREEFHNAKN